MGLEGLINVRNFVENGGLFVTVGSNAAIPIDFGLVDGVSITAPRELRARGSVLAADVADTASPVMFGYTGTVPVYFNSSPIFEVSSTGISGFGGGGGGGGGAASGTAPSRPSGRGGATDPDVPQGRPYTAPQPPSRPGEPSAEVLEQLRPFMPPPEMRPRILLRFAQESSLLLSGMLAGGRELAGKPAIVDLPSGKGHYLLFAINPMWREATQGSFMFLLNAAMHFENLNTPRTNSGATRISELR
jgi:hypothetical protein